MSKAKIMLSEMFCKLALPRQHFIVAGSMPLAVHEIVKLQVVEDIDLIVTNPDTWRVLNTLPSIRREKGWAEGERLILEKFFDDRNVEFVNEWPMAGQDINSIEERVDNCADMRLLSLEDVVRTKASMMRPKDQFHIRLIREWADSVRGDIEKQSPERMKLYRDIQRGLKLVAD